MKCLAHDLVNACINKDSLKALCPCRQMKRKLVLWQTKTS